MVSEVGLLLANRPNSAADKALMAMISSDQEEVRAASIVIQSA
jgi:hypothetical protein